MRPSSSGASGPVAAPGWPPGAGRGTGAATALEMLTSKSYLLTMAGSLLDQAARLLGDDQVLVGRDHPDHDPARRGGDDRRVRGVARRVQPQAEVLEAIADARTDRGRA